MKTTKPKTEPSLSRGDGASERPKQTARKPQTARSTMLHAAWLADPTLGPGPINPATGVSYKHPSEMGLGSSIKKEPPIKKKPAIKKDRVTKKETSSKKAPAIKKESATKKKSAINKEPAVKKEPKPKNKTTTKHEPSSSPSSQTPPSLGLVNGIYDLSCPTVESEWDSSQWNSPSLTLTLALEGTTLWGAYDLGVFTGILFLPTRPHRASPTPIHFTWRGRETGEGEMSFGAGCKGKIAFLGNGRIEGWIGVYGECRFEGRRREEAGTKVRPARSMKGEWEGYNDEAYEEERVGRW